MAGNLGKYALNKTQLKYNLLNETQLETHSGRVVQLGQLGQLGQLTHWHEGISLFKILYEAILLFKFGSGLSETGILFTPPIWL